MATIMPLLKDKIYNQLENSKLKPEYLAVDNESHNHNVPTGSESHFKAVIVSKQFHNQRLIERHKLVYEILIEQLKTIHALSLNCYTPDEWSAKGGKAPASPNCLGGAKSEGKV